MSTIPTRVDLWLEGYAAGFSDGRASRDDELATIQHIADHWYFVANNPEAAAQQRRAYMSWVDAVFARCEDAEKRAAMDAEERAAFEHARALIAEGRSDRDIAVELGLFLPVVANIRAGAL